MNEKKQIIVAESTDKPEKDFSDILDALQDGTKVHGENQYKLSANYIWAKKAEEKMQNFIRRQHLVAVKIKESFPPLKIHRKDQNGNILTDEYGHEIYDQIPNPYAQKAYDLVMLPAEDWVIQNRNTDDNAIIMGILKWGDSSREIIAQKDGDPKDGTIKKIGNYFKKKQREEVLIGDSNGK